MTWVKICGITDLEDARGAVQAGADALGFVFAPSPRRVTPKEAKAIIAGLPVGIEKIGVFVNEEGERVQEIAKLCGLTGIQFHGEEAPEYCVLFSRYKVLKALQMKEGLRQNNLDPYLLPGCVDGILLDTYAPEQAGGTGKSFAWRTVGQFAWRGKPVIIAGGLHPGNVSQALLVSKAQGVDVSSGVERSPGRKDRQKIREFITEVRGFAR